MWIFTRYGFFSVVCARQGQGQPGQPVDPDRVMIRARSRDHLQRLQARFPVLADAEIKVSSQTDYAFRLFAEKDDWATVMSQMTLELDYDNFKAEVHRHQHEAGEDYAHALHDVWGVMHKVQQRHTK